MRPAAEEESTIGTNTTYKPVIKPLCCSGLAAIQVAAGRRTEKEIPVIRLPMMIFTPVGRMRSDDQRFVPGSMDKQKRKQYAWSQGKPHPVVGNGQHNPSDALDKGKPQMTAAIEGLNLTEIASKHGT